MKLGIGMGTSVIGASAPAGLVGYWQMNEASGSRASAVGEGNAAAEVGGSITSATGLIGNCAAITPGKYLALTGDQIEAMIPLGASYTAAGWVQCPSGFGAGVYIAGPMHWDVNSGGYTWRFRTLLYGPPPTGGWGWHVSCENGSGGPYQIAIADYTAWIFVALTWDSASETATFQVNDAADRTFTATARTRTLGDVKCPFTFPHGVYFYTETRVDECSLWSRALSRAERDELYNGGAGHILV